MTDNISAISSERVALASFPRSGNTWLRCLIEQASGIESGSVYSDRIMPRGNNGIIIKTHELDKENYTRSIHLVRSPYDSIASYFHWRLQIGKETVEWEEHVNDCTVQWVKHTQHWISNENNLLVRYEDLRQDTFLQLNRLLKWLVVKKLSANDLKHAISNCSINKMRRDNGELGLQFFGKGLIDNSYHKYTEKQLDFIMSVTSKLQSQLGYGGVRNDRHNIY